MASPSPELPTARPCAGVELDELLEHARQLVRRDARPGVAHRHHDLRALGDHRERHAAPLGEASGVVEQVQHHLAHARAVEAERRRVGVVGLAEGQALALQPRAHHVGRLAGDLGQAGRLALQHQPLRLDLRQVEDVVDEAREVLAGLVDLLDVLAEVGRPGLGAVDLGAGDHHLAEADDEVERGAQLVADGVDELGLEAPRLGQLGLGFGEGVVGALQQVVGVAQGLHGRHRLFAALLGVAGGGLGPLGGLARPVEGRLEAPRHRDRRQADHRRGRGSQQPGAAEEHPALVVERRQAGERVHADRHAEPRRHARREHCQRRQRRHDQAIGHRPVLRQECRGRRQGQGRGREREVPPVQALPGEQARGQDRHRRPGAIPGRPPGRHPRRQQPGADGAYQAHRVEVPRSQFLDVVRRQSAEHRALLQAFPWRPPVGRKQRRAAKPVVLGRGRRGLPPRQARV